MTACLAALVPLVALLGTRLRWTALASWLAGIGAALLVLDMPGGAAGVPDEIVRWLIALALKFLLVMLVAEAAAAAIVARGRVLGALLGAVAGKAAFIALLLRWSDGRDRLPFDALLVLAALAASGAAGATLGAVAGRRG